MRASTIIKKKIKAETFLGVDTSVYENLLSFKYSPLSYNFSFQKGILGSKMGIDDAKLTALNDANTRHTLPNLPAGVSVKSIHLYKKYDFQNAKRDDKLIIRSTDDDFYQISVFETDTYHQISNLSAVGKCCTENYRYNNTDLFLLASEGGSFYTYDGSTVTCVATAPKMTSMCIHAERVFATVSGEQNKVWFSTEFNPVNCVVSGEGAGYIDFDDEGGRVIRVIKFLNYVYVFRDYCVERLTAYGAQTDFSLSKIFNSSTRIYPDTIVSLDDEIYFMTDDGFFALDGYNIKRVMNSVSEFLPFDKSNTFASGINGKYFVATKLNYGADNANRIHDEVGVFINNSLIIYDTLNGKFSIMRGADIRGLLALKVHHESSLLLAFNGNNAGKLGRFLETGKYFSDNLIKYWTTGYTDLSYPDKMKSLRDITLTTSIAITLGVELDGTSIEYAVTGGTIPKKVIVNRPFNKMRLYIKCNGGAISAISQPTISVDLL